MIVLLKAFSFFAFSPIQLVVKDFPNLLPRCVPQDVTMFAQCVPSVSCSVEWCCVLFIFKAFKSLRSPGEEPPRRSGRAFPYL